MKAFTCLLLVLVVLCPTMSCHAEESAAIDIQVSFFDATPDGSIKMHIYVSNDVKSPELRDLRVQITTSTGLSITQGQDDYTFDTLDYYDQRNIFLTLHGPYGSVSSVQVTASASNAPKRVFSCEFESIPTVRALVYGCERNNDGEMRNNVALMKDLFEKSSYNGLPIEVVDGYNYDDCMDFFDILQEWDTEDKDVTYIYICSHGGSRGQLALSYDSEMPYEDMTELIEYINTNVNGRIVLLMSSCYAGITVEAAHNASNDLFNNVDPDRFTILTSTDAEHTSTAVRGEDGYSWFTNDIIMGIETSRADANGDKVVTVGEMHTFLEERANRLLLKLSTLIDLYMIPTLYGNADVPLYNYSADNITDYCILVPINQTLDMSPSTVPPDETPIEMSPRSSAAPESESASELDFTYRVENGEAVVTGYTGTQEIVMIPKTLGGCPVTKLDSHSSFYSASQIVLNEGMQEIGDYACTGHNLLCEVYIPSSVKSIGEYAFGYLWVNSANYASDAHIQELKDEVLDYQYGDLGYLRQKCFTTIHGVPGTAAEEFALGNNMTFIATPNIIPDKPGSAFSDRALPDEDWVLEPCIAADDIQPIETRNYTMSVSGHTQEKMGIWRDFLVGLIDQNGTLLVDPTYDMLTDYDGDYLFSNFSDNGCWQYIGNYGSTDRSVVKAEPLSLPDGMSGTYLFTDGCLYSVGYGEWWEVELGPEETVIAYVDYDSEVISDDWTETYCYGKLGIVGNQGLIVEPIYDEIKSCSWSVSSNGQVITTMYAVCSGEKWGYVDAKGNCVVPISCDPNWYVSNIYGNLASYRYPFFASEGYIAANTDEGAGFYNVEGELVVPLVFTQTRPVSSNGCAWVLYDGLWGVIRLDVGQKHQ